ncbi:serine hydrolase [Synechococcus sp. M16CYN]|uniref:serine hydrolase n=1 Tax=Synechococcus sp. M16CYN TaxID=3103139 RepID=UPI00324F9728
MAFYRPDLGMASYLESVLDDLDAEGRPGLRNSLGLTWVRYTEAAPQAGNGFGASWNHLRSLYPASVVKLFYAVAAERWLQHDLIPDSDELQRALREMISNSSNDATSFVLDLLTGTTSGPVLQGKRWQSWQRQRRLVNDWLTTLMWPELEHVNCCQKTWGDGPYGREKVFYGINNANRNLLTTAAVARMLEAIMTGAVVSPPACRRLQDFLLRSLDPELSRADPENQVDGFLGEGLPEDVKLWSKAGWMSQVRHDAAWWQAPGQPPMMIVAFSSGPDRARDEQLLPKLARALCKYDALTIFG